MDSNLKIDHEGMTRVIFTIGPANVKQNYAPGTRIPFWVDKSILKKLDTLIQNSQIYKSRQDWFEKKLASRPNYPQITEEDFKEKLDQILKESGYGNRTEWLRELIRQELSLT